MLPQFPAPPAAKREHCLDVAAIYLVEGIIIAKYWRGLSLLSRSMQYASMHLVILMQYAGMHHVILMQYHVVVMILHRDLHPVFANIKLSELPVF